MNIFEKLLCFLFLLFFFIDNGRLNFKYNILVAPGTNGQLQGNISPSLIPGQYWLLAEP